MTSSKALHTSVLELNHFLRSSRQLLTTNTTTSSPKFNIVIGNEASDMDSMVSSLVYGHYFSRTTGQHLTPVMPIPRNQFRLRCDVVALFQNYGIDTEALLFDDEVDLATYHQQQQLSITLVDHNELCHAKKHLDTAVIKILDHHQDTGRYMDQVPSEDRLIAFEANDHGGHALVGSCGSLIAECIQNNTSHEPSEIESTLLLSAMALDTVNYDPKAEKVTPRDIAAEKYLSATSLLESAKLYDWLKAEKFNPVYWNDFSLQDCLIYDAKTFQTPEPSSELYTISAILIPIAAFVDKSKATLADALRKHCDETGIEFLLVAANTGSSGKDKRQLLIYAREKPKLQELESTIKSIDVLEAQPLTIDGLKHDCIATLKQQNSSISRKKLVPLLQRAFAKTFQS